MIFFLIFFFIIEFKFILQEPYMEVVNPFILKNKERMIVFLDQLSSITDPNAPPGGMNDSNSSDQLYSDSGKYFIVFF